jgi:hypothetical protein
MSERLTLRERQRRRRGGLCPMCRKERPLFWSCPCGFLICDECLQRDLWGFTCNHITWTCPDCGEERSF